MANDAIAFEKDVLIGSLKSKSVLVSVLESQLEENHFSSGFGRWLYQQIQRYARSSKHLGKRLPEKAGYYLLDHDRSLDDDRRTKYRKRLQAYYGKSTPKSASFGVEILNQHVVRHSFLKAIESSVEIIERGEDIDLAIEKMLSLSFSTKKGGIIVVDYLSNWEERQLFRRQERDNPKAQGIKTCIDSIDACLPRGARPGWLLDIAAKTGRGKSVLLTNFAVAGLFQGKDVALVIIENEIPQVNGRLDACLLRTSYTKLQSYSYLGKRGIKELKRIEKRMQFVRENVSAKLKIIKMSPKGHTVVDLHAQLNRLRMVDGFVPDLLIVDSPDIMASTASFKEYRLAQAAPYWELKALASLLEIPIWASTQLSKVSSDDDPTIEDVAEAYDKARIVDVMFILVRTLELKLKDEAKLHLAKNRDGPDNEVIELRTDLDRMAFM